MIELKPCPFCGGEVELRHSNDQHNRPFVCCKWGVYNSPPCPLGHPYCWDYKNDEDAVKAWNTRKGDNA